MKINTPKNNKTKIILILSILAVVIIAGAGFIYVQAINSNSGDTGTPKRAASDIDQAENIEKEPENKAETPNTDTPPPTGTDEETGKAVVQMIASADVSAGTLYIRGGLNNLVTPEGSCFVTLVGPNGESLKRETTLLQNASTTDCKTISISTGDLSTGVWKYTLNYTSTNSTGKSDEASISIQ